MPLDRTQARKMVDAVAVAYTRGPHAEFIGMLAGHLKEALDAIDGALIESQRAQNEVARVQRDLDDERTAYRKLREQSAHSELVVATLREISKSPKGAAKKAADLLTKLVGVEPVAVPERVVVE